MKITVIGPGSMGLLYGAKLSVCADVTLTGNNPKHIEEINRQGVTVRRDGKETLYRVPAVLNGEGREPADLVLLFTKAYLTEAALAENTGILGPETILMTLQNGAGHEEILSRFADPSRILIGTTAQGSYRESACTIVNSGLGETAVGTISERFPSTAAEKIRALFEKAGFPCVISGNIRQMVWNKLMINASSSVLSGVLQVPQGYVESDPDAWKICQRLIREICRAAASEGYSFDEEAQIERLANHLRNAPGGYTSLYADLKNGRRTEVDYISGAVVRAAAKHGIETPAQQMMIDLVHAMEKKEFSGS